MHNDAIDNMLTSAVPTAHPGRCCGLDAESSRFLMGHLEGRRGDSFLQKSDGTQRDDLRCPGEKVSADVPTEILSKTNGTRESGVDFPTAVARAVGHAVQTALAESADSAEAAKAIIAGVLRGAGDNEDTALKTLSQAARAVIREGILLGNGPMAWIEGILSGAIAGAEALGLHPENAISAAAQGILQGSHEAGVEQAKSVGPALEQTIRALTAGS
jgi:hypothetical protein